MTQQPTLLDALEGDGPRRNAPLDSRLFNHLVRAGYLTEGGIGRRARIRSCNKCRASVLVGLDDVVAALEVHADPTPLSPLGEALATTEDRATYALHHEGGRYVLDPRDAGHITRHPAGTRMREDVLREHRCQTPPPTGPLVTETSFVPRRPTTTTGEGPDF